MRVDPTCWSLVIREGWWEGSYDSPIDGTCLLLERLGPLTAEVLPGAWLVRHADPEVLRAAADRLAQIGAAECEGDAECYAQVLVSPVDGPLGRADWLRFTGNPDGYEVHVVTVAPRAAQVQQCLIEELDARRWTWTAHEDHEVRFGVEFGMLVGAMFRVRYQEARDQVQCIARVTGTVDEALRPRMAEYLARVNWGLQLGGFDFDFATGGIVFRATAPLGGNAPTRAILDSLLCAAGSSLDHWGKGFSAVLQGQEPKAVIEALETELELELQDEDDDGDAPEPWR